MFTVTQDDVVAIRRAFMAGGRDRALVELKRRCLLLHDRTAAAVVDRILAMPVNQPPEFSGRSEPRRDGPGSGRKKERRPF